MRPTNPYHAAVLFLDSDGVLRTTRDVKFPGFLSATPACIEALNRILRAVPVSLVVSSTWREKGLRKLWPYRHAWGVCQRPDSLTPLSQHNWRKPYDRRLRGQEIHAWLDLRRQRHKMPRRFLILDEEDDMGCYRPYLVQTSYADGLTMAQASQIIPYFHHAL